MTLALWVIAGVVPAKALHLKHHQKCESFHQHLFLFLLWEAPEITY